MSTLSNSDVDVMRFYLDNELISNLESLDGNLQTPMHYAARFGRSSAIKLLSEFGANIAPTDRYGRTPLHIAAQENHLSVVEVLIDLSVEIKACSAGCTPLAYAYMSGSVEVIKALEEYERRIEQETRVVNDPKVARTMSNAMLNAIQRNDLDACKGLLQGGCPVDIELSLDGPVTPLMATICINESQPIAQYLIEMGATVSTVYTRPYRGKFFTILEAALAHSRNAILIALFERYFQEAPSLSSLQRSPLHVALSYGNLGGFEILLNFMQQAQHTRKAPEQVALLPWMKP